MFVYNIYNRLALNRINKGYAYLSVLRGLNIVKYNGEILWINP